MGRFAALAVVGSLLVVACGGDDSADSGGGDGGGGVGAEGAPYVEALAATMTSDAELALDEETATCTATAFVELAGVDALEAADISPEDFANTESFADLDVELPSDATARLAADLTECEIGDRIVAGFLDQFATEAGGELPAEASSCLDEAIDRQALSEAMAATFVDGSETDLEALLFDAMAVCPDVMTALVVGTAPGPVSADDEACIRSVIEGNPDLIRAGLMEQEPNASQQLATLLATECPGFGG